MPYNTLMPAHKVNDGLVVDFGELEEEGYGKLKKIYILFDENAVDIKDRL